MKMSMDANELCKDLPPEFARHLKKILTKNNVFLDFLILLRS